MHQLNETSCGRPDYSVRQYLNTRDHTVEDTTVMVIERLRMDDPVLRKIRESRWINLLDTSSPHGMNFRIDSL